VEGFWCIIEHNRVLKLEFEEFDKFIQREFFKHLKIVVVYSLWIAFLTAKIWISVREALLVITVWALRKMRMDECIV
jgi:hypothetical protein